MVPRLVFGLIDIGCGILFILVSLPLVYHKIPMNYLYGFRIPKSLESDESWYAINAYGGKQLILWSLFLIGAGVVKFFLPMEDVDGALALFLFIGPLIIFLSIAIVRTFIFAATL